MYVDSHSLGQLALASKRTASISIYISFIIVTNLFGVWLVNYEVMDLVKFVRILMYLNVTLWTLNIRVVHVM